MQLRELILDKSLRELTVRGKPGFPVAVYDNDMEGFLGGRIPWHWHGELEFAVVKEGSMVVETEGHRSVLRPGDGIFINSGILHRMERLGTAPCKMVTLVFDALLISGDKTNALYTQYVLPLLQCKAIPMLFLSETVSWQEEILDFIWQVFSLFQTQPLLWELDLQTWMAKIWRILFSENRDLFTRKDDNPRNHRLKQMLQFLQENLDQPVTLAQIAQSADISPRECTRCFHDILGISPFTYLLQLRVRAAAVLLEQSSEPITEIGNAVGFSSPSYFGKVFRDHTGQSPREYRQTHTAETAPRSDH